MKAKKLPSQKLLKQLFKYDEETGRLIRISHPVKNQQHLIGKVAGSRHCQGGWQVSVNNTPYLNCRLVWMYCYGEDPGDLEIDHEDEDRSNDRLSNLRIANREQQEANKSRTKRNTSGHKGVSWYKRLSKWRVDVKGKTVGYFSNLDEAISARLRVAQQVSGEFAK